VKLNLQGEQRAALCSCNQQLSRVNLRRFNAAENMAPQDYTGNYKTQRYSTECKIILDDSLFISGFFFVILKQKRA